MVSQAVNDGSAVLDRALARYRGQVQRAALARAWSVLATVVLVAVSILWAAFAIFPWTVLLLLFDVIIGLVALTALWELLDVYVFRPVTAARVAGMLDRRSGEEHPLIALAFQLARDDMYADSPLARETVRRALESLQRIPRRLPGLFPRRSASVAVLSVLLAIGATFIPGPRITDYWALPFASRDLSVSIEPGTVYVPTGARVTLRLVADNRLYPSCGLALRSPDGTERTFRALTADSNGVFSLQTDSLRRSLVYTFAIGGRELAPETLHVVVPPALHGLQLTIKPPAYTKLAERSVPQGQGNVTTPVGSQVGVRITAPFALSDARLIAGADTVSLAVEGVNAAGSFTLRRSSAYTFTLIDSLGQRSDSLPRYFAEALPDESPLVQILRPGANIAVSPAMRESVMVQAADDYGLRSLAIEYRVSRGESIGRESAAIKGAPAAARLILDWDLVQLRLYPGDSVFYWAVATDNRPWGGGNRAISDTFWMRVPGFEEIHRQQALRSEQAQESMQQVRDNQKELEKRLEDLVRSNRGNKELTWEQRQVLKDVQRQAESQRDSLQSAVERLREAVEAMQEEATERDEIARKMDEVREAIEELVKQYGDSLLFDTKSEERDVSAEDMIQALEKMKEMLPQLSERLEQAMKYLEMLRRDQQLEALAQRFSEMAAHQEQVSAMDDSASQNRRQADVLRGTEQLARDTRERMQPGQEQLLESTDVPSLDNVESLAQQLQAMAKQDSPRGQCQSARRQMSASMLSASQEIRNSMSSAMMQRMEAERQRMLGLVHDALSIAQWQEEQGREVQRSQDIAGQVRAQQALRQALGAAAGQLDSLRMVAPQTLGEISGLMNFVERAMHRAEQALEGGAAAVPMAEASAGLAGAAQALLEASGGMMNGQNGGGSGGGGMQGMMGAMRRMSGRQAAINAATGDLLRQMLQGKSGSGGMEGGGEGRASAQAREDARRAQQELADQLNKLAEEYGQQTGPGGAERMKELEQEARRLARMLESPSEELRERQDRFLARMLQTTLSIHREEEGKEERKSRSASSLYAPGGAQDGARRFADTDIYYRLRQQAFQGNLPPEYRGAVKAYLDSLGVLYLRSPE